MSSRFLLLAIALSFLLAGCESDPDPAASADAGPDSFDSHDADENFPFVQALDLPNALGAGGHSLLPWPSDQYIAVDDDGSLQLAPDAQLLPPAFVPSVLHASGVSRITPIVTWLKGGIDPESLPDPDDWGASLTENSPIRVVVLQDGHEPTSWPILAEVDATSRNTERATLLLRPHRPFPPGAQVVVGLRTSLRTAACQSQPSSAECKNHETLPALARILAGSPQGRAEESWMGRGRDALLAALPMIGPDVDDLAQAFSFTVRDQQEVVEPLALMQQIAAEADSSSYVLEEIEYDDDRALIYGELDVPWFLDEDNLLVLDDQGRPVVQETRPTPFLVTIPMTVTQTRPVVLFGHGFFSSIEETTWGNFFNGLSRWEMAAVSTRFHGFAEADFVDTALALTSETMEDLVAVIDLQRQSQANFTVVHNMIRDHLAAELTVDFGDGEFHPLDATQIPYMGISNGGTQGLVMMSTSPVLTRGALIVPGGGWSHMLQRASQWSTLGVFFADRFSTDAELQIAMAMLQQIFDPVDSLNFAQYLVDVRLPDVPQDPQILIVEAVNDAQVANLVTRWVAAAASVPQILPSVANVFGIDTVEASSLDHTPLSVGYELYDLGADENPPGNIAATENDVHNDVRLLDAYREQVGIFLETGHIRRTCDGPCDPE